MKKLLMTSALVLALSGTSFAGMAPIRYPVPVGTNSISTNVWAVDLAVFWTVGICLALSL